jgi:hypothetical protein
MRKRNFHLAIIVGSILILSLGLSSCSTSKKAAIACPDISINKGYKLSSNHKNNNLLALKRTKPIRHPRSSLGKNPSIDKRLFNNSNLTDFSRVSEIENIQYQNTHELSELMIASIDNKLILPRVTTSITPLEAVERTYQQDRCDTIILKSGKSLVGKVDEIGLTEIKYRNCNNLSGPIISIAKSSASAILFSNGSHEIFTVDDPALQSNNASNNGNTDERQVEGFGIAGLAAGVVGLFIAGIPLGVVAIVFGAISLSRIKKYPKKYKGKGLAIASLILGVVDVVAMLILLAVVV